MNTPEISKMMHEIYRDFTRYGRKTHYYDSEIKNFIISFYNRTEIDMEEVKNLWIEYLDRGTLSLDKAVTYARCRIEGEKRNAERKVKMKNKYIITKLDFANCTKYPEIVNDPTLQTLFTSLLSENATQEAQKLICQKIIEYLRYMCDLRIIPVAVFNDCVQDLHYIKNTIKEAN